MFMKKVILYLLSIGCVCSSGFGAEVRSQMGAQPSRVLLDLYNNPEIIPFEEENLDLLQAEQESKLLRKRVSDLSKKLAELQKDNVLAKSRLGLQGATGLGLANMTESFIGKFDRLKEEKEELEEQSALDQQTNEELNNKINTIEGELDGLFAELEAQYNTGVAFDKDHPKESINQLLQKLAETNAEFRQQKENELKHIREALVFQRNKEKEILEKLKANPGAADVMVEVTSHMAKYGELTNQFEALKKKYGKVLASRDNLNTTQDDIVKDLNDFVLQLSGAHPELTANLGSLSADSDNYRAVIANLNDALLKAYKEEIEARKREVKKEVEAHKLTRAEAQRLSSEIQKAKAELANGVGVTGTELGEKVESILSQYENIQNSFANSKTTLGMEQSKTAGLLAELNTLKKDMSDFIDNVGIQLKINARFDEKDPVASMTAFLKELVKKDEKFRKKKETEITGLNNKISNQAYEIKNAITALGKNPLNDKLAEALKSKLEEFGRLEDDANRINSLLQESDAENEALKASKQKVIAALVAVKKNLSANDQQAADAFANITLDENNFDASVEAFVAQMTILYESEKMASEAEKQQKEAAEKVITELEKDILDLKNQVNEALIVLSDPNNPAPQNVVSAAVGLMDKLNQKIEEYNQLVRDYVLLEGLQYAATSTLADIEKAKKAVMGAYNRLIQRLNLQDANGQPLGSITELNFDAATKSMIASLQNRLVEAEGDLSTAEMQQYQALTQGEVPVYVSDESFDANGITLKLVPVTRGKVSPKKAILNGSVPVGKSKADFSAYADTSGNLLNNARLVVEIDGIDAKPFLTTVGNTNLEFKAQGAIDIFGDTAVYNVTLKMDNPQSNTIYKLKHYKPQALDAIPYYVVSIQDAQLDPAYESTFNQKQANAIIQQKRQQDQQALQGHTLLYIQKARTLDGVNFALAASGLQRGNFNQAPRPEAGVDGVACDYAGYFSNGFTLNLFADGQDLGPIAFGNGNQVIKDIQVGNDHFRIKVTLKRQPQLSMHGGHVHADMEAVLFEVQSRTVEVKSEQEYHKKVEAMKRRR